MPDLQPLIENLHFLRPWWLAGIAVVVLGWWLLRGQGRADRQWSGVIAPHLLGELIVGRQKRKIFGPVNAAALTLIVGSVAAAGPSWERELPPFAEDEAPLVIALDLSQTMNAIDIQPTRLERAKLKVRDLLALRSGARTALVAYSGTAHIVLPLTDDGDLITSFLEPLVTDVMPVPGQDPAAALGVAERLLEPEEAAGTILFVTDAMPASATPAFVEHAATSLDAVMVLAVGTTAGGPVKIGDNRWLTGPGGARVTAALNREQLEEFAAATGAYVTTITEDDADVERLNRRVDRHMTAVRNQETGERWKDGGWVLTIPMLVLSLLWLRRGWVVRWEA